MRRRVALAAVAWCLVVVVGSVVVWQAIGAAGRDIFDDEEALAPTLSSETQKATATPAPSSPAAPSTELARPTKTTATSTPSPGGATSPAAVSGTWQGRQGRVVVSCTGVRAALESASPADGYSMEVDERGPARVRVEFSDDEHDLRIEARCIGGAPRFEVDDSRSGSSG